MSDAKRILLVEDDPEQRELFHLALTMAGHVVMPVIDAEDALHLLRIEPFTLVLTDWILPQMKGDDLVRTIKADCPCLLTILMSSYGHVNEAAQACGANAWFRKTDGVFSLRSLVTSLLSAPPPAPCR